VLVKSQAGSWTKSTATSLCQLGTRTTQLVLAAPCSIAHCTRTIVASASAARLSLITFRPIGSAASNVGLAAALSSKALYTLTATTPARAFTFRCASLADSSVHVVLVWTDPAGNPAALKQLVNDLDLIVYVGSGQKIFGNTGAFADTSNTVEKAVVSCASGGTVTAIVTAGKALLTAAQAFALVANGNVITELAQEVTPLPAFSSGRPAAIPTTTKPCGDPADLVNESPEFHIAAPMKFKNPAFKLPQSELAASTVVAHFTASLAMLLAVPEYSVFFQMFTSGPWIGFACGSYVCMLSGTAAPCYLVRVFSSVYVILLRNSNN
jgi:hypothetical protein